MGIPDILVVHNLIPGTGSYFYTDKRIHQLYTSTTKLRRRQAVPRAAAADTRHASIRKIPITEVPVYFFTMQFS
jgi:hypothetical protein